MVFMMKHNEDSVSCFLHLAKPDDYSSSRLLFTIASGNYAASFVDSSHFNMLCWTGSLNNNQSVIALMFTVIACANSHFSRSKASLKNLIKSTGLKFLSLRTFCELMKPLG